MAAEATSAPVASEADFDVKETKNEQKVTVESTQDAANQQKVTGESTKAAAAEDAKNNEAAENKDTTDATKPSEADKEKDDKKDKAEAQDDQDWGNWSKSKKSWDWENQGWQQQDAQNLSKGSRQRLNKAMKDLCRPVHCEALTYVLPDRSKKACLTWRSAIDHCVQEPGKAPMWAEYFLKEWEQHYVTKHADETLFQQCLRRVRQWGTKDCTQNEVEAAVELIYGIGQQIGRSNKDIEASILDATGVATLRATLMVVDVAIQMTTLARWKACRRRIRRLLKVPRTVPESP